jgi:hypothetical protein
MGRRDWAGTVFVACLLAASAYLHDHALVVGLLLAAAACAALLVVYDVGRERGRQSVNTLLADEQAKSQEALESQRHAYEAELAELAVTPDPDAAPPYSPAAIFAAARMSRMSVPQGSAVILGKLRELIPEGEAMKARVADRRGPTGLVQHGGAEEAADWEARVSTVLARWPKLLAQFQGALPPRVFAMSGPAAELHDRLEARLKVLYAIVRGMEDRP